MGGQVVRAPGSSAGEEKSARLGAMSCAVYQPTSISSELGRHREGNGGGIVSVVSGWLEQTRQGLDVSLGCATHGLTSEVRRLSTWSGALVENGY